MLIIEYTNNGTEFFEPMFFVAGTPVQKVKRDFGVSTCGGDSTVFQQFDTDDALIINGDEYDIGKFDTSQIVISRYSVFDGNPDEDGYFYTHDSESFTISFTWNGIDESVFDASKLKIYAYEVVFIPCDGDEWSELYLDKLNTPPAKAGGFLLRLKSLFRLKPVSFLLKQAKVTLPQSERYHLPLPVALCIA